MPVSGSIADASASTPIRRLCAGPLATGSAKSPPVSAWRHARATGRAGRMGCARNEAKGAFVGALDDTELDASVLRLAEIGLIAPRDPRFVATCDAIGDR